MNEDLIAEAEIGEEARQFIESDLGKCLIGMAQQDSLEAQRKLLDVDAEDKAAVRNLQLAGRLGEMFEQYLAELIHRGNNAMQVFVQQRDE